MGYGYRLKKLREDKKLSQQQLADALKINRSTYARYELGQTQPDYETLKKIASYYHVTTDFILGRSNDPRLTEVQDQKYDERVDKMMEKIEKLPKDKQELVLKRIFKIADTLIEDEE